MTEINAGDYLKSASDMFAEQYGFTSGVAAGLFKSAFMANIVPIFVSVLALMFSMWLISSSLRVISNSFRLFISMIFYTLVILLGMHFYNIGLSATLVIMKNNALQLSAIALNQLHQLTQKF